MFTPSAVVAYWIRDGSTPYSRQLTS